VRSASERSIGSNTSRCRRKNPNSAMDAANIPCTRYRPAVFEYSSIVCDLRPTNDRAARNAPVTMNPRPK
jgi:hypothetical protein